MLRRIFFFIIKKNFHSTPRKSTPIKNKNKNQINNLMQFPTWATCLKEARDLALMLRYAILTLLEARYDKYTFSLTTIGQSSTFKLNGRNSTTHCQIWLRNEDVCFV